MSCDYVNVLILRQGYQLILDVLPGSSLRDGIRGHVLQGGSIAQLEVGAIVLTESPFRVSVRIVMPNARLQTIIDLKGATFNWRDLCEDIEVLLQLGPQKRIELAERLESQNSKLSILTSSESRQNGFRGTDKVGPT